MSKQVASRVPAGSAVGRATGFELASRDQARAANIEVALARNRVFAAAGGHEGAVVFPTLRVLVITCLDPRVDPAHFLGLGLSDAMVVRNAGGRVTHEVINDVAFVGQLAENVLPGGPLFEVAVIYHTQCGTGALADDAFCRRYAERIGADESTLREHAILAPAATVTSDSRTPPLRTGDLPARNRLRARLRRRQRSGRDGDPRGPHRRLSAWRRARGRNPVTLSPGVWRAPARRCAAAIRND